jgi:ATP-dependent RNA helicase RhlE
VAPDEEGELRQIERAIGKRLPRVTVPDFDYAARPEGRFEVPLAERIAAIRAKKAEERARARANAERRAGRETGGARQPSSPAGANPRGPSGSKGGHGGHGGHGPSQPGSSRGREGGRPPRRGPRGRNRPPRAR